MPNAKDLAVIPAVTTHKLGSTDHASAAIRGHTRHLTQFDLARRWVISPRTLERWRWLKQGPPYLRVGGRVIYRLEDIEQYEQLNLRKLENPKLTLTTRSGIS